MDGPTRSIMAYTDDHSLGSSGHVLYNVLATQSPQMPDAQFPLSQMLSPVLRYG